MSVRGWEFKLAHIWPKGSSKPQHWSDRWKEDALGLIFDHNINAFKCGDKIIVPYDRIATVVVEEVDRFLNLDNIFSKGLLNYLFFYC